MTAPRPQPPPPDCREAVRAAILAAEHEVLKMAGQYSPRWTGTLVLRRVAAQIRGLLP